MFSHLMRCIIESLPENIEIISPEKKATDEKLGVGLYPDRVFVKGEIDACEIRKMVLDKFSKDTKLNKDSVENYFNIMSATTEANSESEAIAKLNKQLDYLELNNRTIDDNYSKFILSLSPHQDNSQLSQLYFIAKGEKYFPIESLGEISAYTLKNNTKWEAFRKKLLDNDNTSDPFKEFGDDLKSYHKYICVVQADGDNVGKTVSHKDLPDDAVKNISKELLNYGEAATEAIKSFGGLPIYAGGDDLFFIAPVVGENGQNIFELLKDIDNSCFNKVKSEIDKHRIKDDKGEEIHASLSYGISITYYKHPLYEALNAARDLLFRVAKNVDGKNAIAWNLQKHSGSSFFGAFSKDNEGLYKAFEKVIKESKESETVVSAVSHKIRGNEGLLKLWIDAENADERNKNFFEKYMDYASKSSDPYKEAALELLNQLFKTNKDISELTKTMYGMLRTAKFINGEEAKDE